MVADRGSSPRAACKGTLDKVDTKTVFIQPDSEDEKDVHPPKQPRIATKIRERVKVMKLFLRLERFALRL
jgi:hypothetical protein